MIWQTIDPPEFSRGKRKELACQLECRPKMPLVEKSRKKTFPNILFSCGSRRGTAKINTDIKRQRRASDIKPEIALRGNALLHKWYTRHVVQPDRQARHEKPKTGRVPEQRAGVRAVLMPMKTGLPHTPWSGPALGIRLGRTLISCEPKCEHNGSLLSCSFHMVEFVFALNSL